MSENHFKIHYVYYSALLQIFGLRKDELHMYLGGPFLAFCGKKVTVKSLIEPPSQFKPPPSFAFWGKFTPTPNVQKAQQQRG